MPAYANEKLGNRSKKSRVGARSSTARKKAVRKGPRAVFGWRARPWVLDSESFLPKGLGGSDRRSRSSACGYAEFVSICGCFPMLARGSFTEQVFIPWRCCRAVFVPALRLAAFKVNYTASLSRLRQLLCCDGSSGCSRFMVALLAPVISRPLAAVFVLRFSLCECD